MPQQGKRTLHRRRLLRVIRQGHTPTVRRLGGNPCPHTIIDSLQRNVLFPILRKIVATREIRFARRLQSGHPSPPQRVAGGIRIEQMFEKETRTRRPRQTVLVAPPRRPPHACVVVQIAGGTQLLGKNTHSPVRRHLGCRFRRQADVIRPHSRMLLQPSFPISAPDHLLHELLHRRKAMHRQHRGHHLLLRDQPVAQSRGQPRHIAVSGPHKVPRAGIIRSPHWHKLLESLPSGGAAGRKVFHRLLNVRPAHQSCLKFPREERSPHRRGRPVRTARRRPFASRGAVRAGRRKKPRLGRTSRHPPLEPATGRSRRPIFHRQNPRVRRPGGHLGKKRALPRMDPRFPPLRGRPPARPGRGRLPALRLPRRHVFSRTGLGRTAR